MSFGSDMSEGGEDRETETQAVSMEDKLRKDVASWSGERREQLGKHATELKQSVVKPPSPRPVARSKAPIAAKPATKQPDAPSKPFSMSYGGMTEAEYIQYRLDRGSR